MLTSLVRRATGQATAGLRPRIASRFEAPAESGFTEVNEEVTVSVSAQPSLQPDFERKQPRILDEHNARPERPESPPQPEVASDFQPLLEQPAQPDIPQMSHAAHSTVDLPQPFVPLFEQVEADASNSAEAVVPPERKPELSPESEPPIFAIPESPVSQSPPDPLLCPTRELELPAQLTQPASPGPALADPEPEAVEPEITIHIGQLDVRARQPSQPATQRQAPARPRAAELPSLSDYLRGGGS
ncbi:MAG: hypothetical protein AB3N15_01530 [Paracoccaceae bacterium]